jgi:hypothetical protein
MGCRTASVKFIIYYVHSFGWGAVFWGSMFIILMFGCSAFLFFFFFFLLVLGF